LLVLVAIAGCTRARPITVVCLGDSVTVGEREGVSRSEAFCARLPRDLKSAGLDVATVNAGVGGNTTADALRRFDRDVLARKPNVVLIMFGINDSWIETGHDAPTLTVQEYQANLRTMLVRLRQSRIAAVLVTPNPVAAPKFPASCNERLATYVEAMRKIAHEQHLPLVDVFAKFEGAVAAGATYETLLVDSMHPNGNGHALIARLILETLIPLLKSNSSR
jgi:acyl-CoA thioesterase-1